MRIHVVCRENAVDTLRTMRFVLKTWKSFSPLEVQLVGQQAFNKRWMDEFLTAIDRDYGTIVKCQKTETPMVLSFHFQDPH